MIAALLLMFHAHPSCQPHGTEYRLPRLLMTLLNHEIEDRVLVHVTWVRKVCETAALRAFGEGEGLEVYAPHAPWQ